MTAVALIYKYLANAKRPCDCISSSSSSSNESDLGGAITLLLQDHRTTMQYAVLTSEKFIVQLCALYFRLSAVVAKVMIVCAQCSKCQREQIQKSAGKRWE